MKRSKPNLYVGCSVTFPEPWDAIRRPGVRLCLGDPCEVVTQFSRFCIPVFTLCSDSNLTNNIKSYAHYSRTIKGYDGPDVAVSYLTLPRFMLALRVDAGFRALVLTSPLCVSEG